MARRPLYALPADPCDCLKQGCERPWEVAADPFPVAPRTWYVGNAWVGAYLLDSTEGLILIAMRASPFMARLAPGTGPWENVSLGFCAIALVAALSRGSIFLGMASAGLGLLVSTVGFAPIDGSARFTFGSIYLSGGLELIPLMLGLLALKQIVSDHARGQVQVPDIDMSAIKGFGVPLPEDRDTTWTMIRSFLIGFSCRGLGAALGIPGDGVTALLLGGTMILGIQAGPLLVTNNPGIVYALFETALLAVAVLSILWPYVGPLADGPARAGLNPAAPTNEAPERSGAPGLVAATGQRRSSGSSASGRFW